MKFSEFWLREWVNLVLDSNELAYQITMAGMKVESIKPVADKFSGVVIGEVVECKRYSNIDEIRIVRVNIGRDRPLNIFCKKRNFRKGSKVVVATIDAMLHKNEDYIVTIKTLHNKQSEGILCSFSELGIYEGNYNGIIELPTDAPIGTDVRKYLKLDDNIIEISVPSNRIDCFSVIGLARDIAAVNHIELNVSKIEPIVSTINDTLPVQIDSPSICPRYLGRIVKSIDTKITTPLWMKEKLRRCGICSINIVIDITNYILLEFGQLVHLLDLDQIEGGIIVRMAREGESTMLKGDKIALNTDTIVISDHKKVLMIASVFNSEYSSIHEDTQNILLGCAFYSSSTIKNNLYYYNSYVDISRRCNIICTDLALQNKAIEYATRLFIDICGGKAGPMVDITNKKYLPKRAIIILRRSKLDFLLGYHISDIQVNDILRCIGCKIIRRKNEWKVVIPIWRLDIRIEEDLVEEIARIYGYNNIPNKEIRMNLKVRDHRESVLSLNRVKNMLNDKGYQEVITYSFVNPKYQQLIHPGKKALMLLNPISREMSVMRLSLWTGLLEVIIYNQRHQQSRIRIFETGTCFIPDMQTDLSVRQNFILAGAISGNYYEEHWDIKSNIVDFYDMKGDIESILDLTGKLSNVEFRSEVIPALHSGQSAAIYLHKNCIGFIGVINPELEYKFGLKKRTILFELEWDKISDCLIPKAKTVSRFPANRRDISIIVAEDVPAADIVSECKKICIDQIIDIKLFDVYRGKSTEKGYKNLAISLILQDSNRTLREEEITAITNKCVETLKMKFQVSLKN